MFEVVYMYIYIQYYRDAVHNVSFKHRSDNLQWKKKKEKNGNRKKKEKRFDLKLQLGEKWFE